MRLVTTSALRVASAAAILGLLIPTVLGHGEDEAMDMGMGSDETFSGNASQPESEIVPSYFAHPEHRGILLGHIGLMVLAWVIVLPLATMFSLAQSRMPSSA